ncbi:MAG: hypothetical protein R2761_15615 [Acidimicrobiales bacterium]
MTNADPPPTRPGSRPLHLLATTAMRSVVERPTELADVDPAVLYQELIQGVVNAEAFWDMLVSPSRAPENWREYTFRPTRAGSRVLLMLMVVRTTFLDYDAFVAVSAKVLLVESE